MKHRMGFRLFLYFSLALLSFAMILGGLFHMLFLQYLKDHQTGELRHHAQSMAEVIESHPRADLLFGGTEEPSETAESFYQGHHGMGRHRRMMQDNDAQEPLPSSGTGSQHMYCRRTFRDTLPQDTSDAEQASLLVGQYLKELNTLAHGEVWLVDAKNRSFSLYGTETATSYNELPREADAMLEKVFLGETGISEDFSPLLSAPSATIGVPLHDKNGQVIGALLLHRTLKDLNAAQQDSRKLLAISLIAALLISLLLASLLSRRFVRPLQHMEQLAAELTGGNYAARSDIHQEDEIGSLARSLDTLAARLGKASQERARLQQMRQDFITNISHELRTPITILRGTLELISSGLATDEEKRKNYLKQMMSNIIGLQRLVNDLFELSRLQNADFNIDKSPLNLGDALQDALQTASQLAGQKDVRLQCPQEPFVFPMEGDYDRLRQMFLTVLDNAVKFSPEGSSIEVTCQKEEHGWNIQIRDHGPGIPEDELPHIFERFHSRKDKANPNGTGLGLPIALEIARRHEISLQCRNMENGGACISFSMAGTFINHITPRK